MEQTGGLGWTRQGVDRGGQWSRGGQGRVDNETDDEEQGRTARNRSQTIGDKGRTLGNGWRTMENGPLKANNREQRQTLGTARQTMGTKGRTGWADER